VVSYFTNDGELLYKYQMSDFTNNQVYEPAVARTRDMAVAQRRSVVQHEGRITLQNIR